MKTYRVVPTEAETTRLISETTSNGKMLDLCFGPSGAWIEWREGEPEPWTVDFLRHLRGDLVTGMHGDGI